MKILLTVCTILGFFCSTFAQVSRTTTQLITATDINTINLSLDDSAVEIIETKGSRIIIESTITLENINNMALLNFVIKSGRYALENKVNQTTETLTIIRKKAQNALISKGESVREFIKYRILIPSTVKFVNKGVDEISSIN